MFGGMKNVIEQHCPVINRINPASVLSDAFYCLSVYDDAVRYQQVYPDSCNHVSALYQLLISHDKEGTL